MNSLRALLTSPRSYAIFVAATALAAFIFPEFFDSVFLGGSFHPLGIFQRLIIAMIVGILALLVSLVLFLFLQYIWEGSVDYSQPEPLTSRSPRRRKGRDESYAEGLGQTAAAAFSERWTGDGLSTPAEIGVFDTGSSESGNEEGFESGGEGFGGGNAGGGGSGGDYSGGDFGGGDGGGGDGGSSS